MSKVGFFPYTDPLSTFCKQIGHNDRLIEFFRFFILLLIGVIAIGSRLFSVIRYESIIHEFDPWFNYRATKYLVENGFFSFLNWFDDTAWYPLGRVVGHTVYPGIMITSAVIHYILNSLLSIKVDIREVCVFLAPVFSAATAYVVYGLTLEIAPNSHTAALLGAFFMGVIPGYISRSVAGSYDNEAIAIFLLGATFLMWLRAVRRGSPIYAILTAFSYFAMVSSWGGYVFITNLIPLHTLSLIFMGYFTTKVYTAYSIYFCLGNILSTLIPFLNTCPFTSSEHLGSIAVFGLVQLLAIGAAILDLFPETEKKREEIKAKLIQLLIGIIALCVVGFFLLLATGFIPEWGGRFRSLFDTSYAKKHSPLIASVSEHQPTPWGSFFMDLHLLLFTFPAAIWMMVSKFSNNLANAEKKISVEGALFFILYGFTASYFASVMVRLMLTLSPIVCVGGGIVLGAIQERISNRIHRIGFSFLDSILLIFIFVVLVQFARHCTWVTSTAYSSPSVVLSSIDNMGNLHIIDDYRDAYYWIRKNTPRNSRVFSWWDYGYQLAGFSDRVTIVDNNTWNFTHIALVGKAFASPEPSAYEQLRELDVDYVLVVAGVASGYSGDDINKFLWMIKIAEDAFGPAGKVHEEEFYGENGQYRVDAKASPAMKSSLLYKLVYHNFDGARDYAREGTVLPNKIEPLESIEEVFSSERFIVRVYKVLPPDALGRSHAVARAFEHRYRK